MLDAGQPSGILTLPLLPRPNDTATVEDLGVHSIFSICTAAECCGFRCRVCLPNARICWLFGSSCFIPMLPTFSTHCNCADTDTQAHRLHLTSPVSTNRKQLFYPAGSAVRQFCTSLRSLSKNDVHGSQHRDIVT